AVKRRNIPLTSVLVPAPGISTVAPSTATPRGSLTMPTSSRRPDGTCADASVTKASARMARPAGYPCLTRTSDGQGNTSGVRVGVPRGGRTIGKIYGLLAATPEYWDRRWSGRFRRASLPRIRIGDAPAAGRDGRTGAGRPDDSATPGIRERLRGCPAAVGCGDDGSHRPCGARPQWWRDRDRHAARPGRTRGRRRGAPDWPRVEG